MSMDEQDAVRCAICNCPVLDYEPGKSSVIVDGLMLHPECAAADGLVADDERDEETLPAGTDWPADESHRMSEAQGLRR